MTIKPATVSTMALRCFTPANLRVRTATGCDSNTVVALFERLMPASVECGRMLVSISLDTFADPTPILDSLDDNESLTRAVPSARQKASASSGSRRLHCGQRFIFGVLRLVAAFLFRKFSRPSGSVSDPSLTRGKAVTSHRTPKLLRNSHAP